MAAHLSPRNLWPVQKVAPGNGSSRETASPGVVDDETAHTTSSKSQKARTIASWFKPRITFYRIHVAVFLVVMFAGTLLIYLTPSSGPIAFIDAMYVATSALCVTGLISVEVAVLSTYDRLLLMVLMFVGSQVFTSLVPVLVRRYYFHRYLLQAGLDVDGVGPPPEMEVSSGEQRDEVEGSTHPTAASTAAQGLEVYAEEPGTSNDEAEEETSAAARTEAAAAAAAGAGAGTAGGSSMAPTLSPPDRKISMPRSAGNTPKGLRSISFFPRGQASPAPDAVGVAARSVSEQPATQALPRSASTLSGVTIASLLTRRLSVNQREDEPGRLPSDFGPGEIAEGEEDGEEGARGDMRRKSMGGLVDGVHAAESHTWAGATAAENAENLRRELSRIRQMQSLRRLQSQLQRGQRLEDGQQQEQQQQVLPRLSSTAAALNGDETIDPLMLDSQVLRFIELRALELLSWLVPVYMLGFLAFSAIVLSLILGLWPYYRDQVLAPSGVNPVFLAVFQAISAFANAGLSLFDDNLIQFQANLPFLLVIAILILVGNTMYAPTLRGILHLIHRFSRGDRRFVAKYLLDHPRKCYTQLFPGPETIWLIVTVVLFNAVEFIFFIALDWNSPALGGLSSAVKVLDGMFQAISTRNAGYNVIPLALLSSAMLVLYAGMMYVAVYPVFITRQRSREQREVYDDEDIGVFMEDLQEGVMDNTVLEQGKKLVGRDSALIFLSIFVICIIESGPMTSDPTNFSVFNIIFEVISAYGNVGLSLGYTCVPPSPQETCESPPYSFSGVWSTGSKLIIILVMFLGRHRGLPDNIDAAIVIPDRKQFEVHSYREPMEEELREPHTVQEAAAETAAVLMRAATMMPARTTSQPSTLVRRISRVIGLSQDHGSLDRLGPRSMSHL